MQILKAHEQWFANANASHQAKPEYLRFKDLYTIFQTSMDAASQQQSEAQYIIDATTAFNAYKDNIDQWPASKAFNAQSKFHSTIHEEFWVYIGLEALKRTTSPTPAHLYLGSGNSLQGLFFHPSSLEEALGNTVGHTIKPKFKDRDFMIALKVPFNLTINGHNAGIKTRAGINEIFLPLITIECKQYLDKTMLDNALSAATKLKTFSPHTLDIVTIELNKLADVNIAGSGVDGFFVLRKQRLSEVTYGSSGPGPKDTVNVQVRNPVDSDVVFRVYDKMKEHLNKTTWHASVDDFLGNGYL